MSRGRATARDARPRCAFARDVDTVDAIALDRSNALDREFDRADARESNVSTFDPRSTTQDEDIRRSPWCVRARAFVVRERRERERENRPTDQNRRDRVARRHLEGRRANSAGQDGSETNITKTPRLNRDETGGWCPRTRTITPPRTFLADGTDGCITRTTNRGYRTPRRR